jgi:hypothetical protein
MHPMPRNDHHQDTLLGAASRDGFHWFDGLTQLLHAEIQPNSGRTGFREETNQAAKGILIVTTEKQDVQKPAIHSKRSARYVQLRETRSEKDRAKYIRRHHDRKNMQMISSWNVCTLAQSDLRTNHTPDLIT